MRPPSRVKSRRLSPRDVYNWRARRWKRLNPRCMACYLIFERAPKPTRDVHHSRGRLGPLLLDETFWIPVCGECHDYIHNNIAVARALGLICAAGQWNSVPK